MLHGHSYSIQCFSETAPGDRPTPLADMEAAAQEIRSTLDHKNLDHYLEPSTMENIAKFILMQWTGPSLKRVIVSRPTIGCGVEWRA